MNIFPIIVRELRAQSRHPINYSLRLFGAALSTLLLAFFLWGKPDTQSGNHAFGILSLATFCSVWIVVPLITADSLSREKREGTLGLLFLTPLTPIEIIFGKGIIHAIRSLTLLIAVVPIMTIPFLLGGITTSDVLWSLFFNLSALALSLAAGLLASSLCQLWSRAAILAAIFATALAVAFLEIATASFFLGISYESDLLDKLEMLVGLFFFASRGQMFPGSFPSIDQILSMSSSLLASSLLICLLVLLFAASRLKSSWQDNPPSARQNRMRKIFCTPRFWVGFLRQRNQSQLSRNPIGWLQQYSWSARLSKWGWCAIIILIFSWLLTVSFSNVRHGCAWLKTALLVSMAFSAVGSFQREKQNGALELLLVTPLREKQIIWGRLWGIWGQFLPAFLILILTMMTVPEYSYYRYSRMAGDSLNIFNAIRDFIIVPMVGLYFAMRMKNFMVAWLSTCALTMIIPKIVFDVYMRSVRWMGTSGDYEQHWQNVSFTQTLLLGFIGAISMAFLYAHLKTRTFALGRF